MCCLCRRFCNDTTFLDAYYVLQEKQLKKIRAKQKRLQAFLDGENIQKLEAELLIEDDEGRFEALPWIINLQCTGVLHPLVAMLNNHFKCGMGNLKKNVSCIQNVIQLQ